MQFGADAGRVLAVLHTPDEAKGIRWRVSGSSETTMSYWR